MKKFIFTLITATLLSTGVQAQSNSVATQNTQVVQQSVLERNKANVLDFYELAFNQHKLQEAVSKHVGAEYLQHNPTVADGGQAFIDAFAPFLKSHPQSKATVKRVVADGDLVWLHVHSQLDDKDRGEAVVDIFRLDENGKIVEHWDVIQAVPEKTESGRGMF
ncbi:nuclear transport factor 2 family protein [Neisseria sp. ZJ106]|uniref:Nuclear transport factor 2 family protein n=1 Tax=Neisseria lisongii TaxID=2912188 RepID=A0ABY7RKS3_9NEIS|nr:nuclear transport factor 2 family protein [Neisseria lisongii]MCF7522110.1 nuclear transport factor 2 family protein [Neisseria lisongii]WCL71949.1 nuclear transport factor 2 family protein [Neisseria lisongii]